MKIEGFAQSFSLEFSEYLGVDFSKRCLLFCGQGQMLPGSMAETVKKLPLFEPFLRELDRVAAESSIFRPSDFILNPKNIRAEDQATSSVLCLFALQVAMFETLVQLKGRPALLSAHSFGEFAMMTCAGVVSFGDMVKLLCERQKSLSLVVGKFSMLAVNSKESFDSSSFGIELYRANLNSRLQSSYVCRSEDLDKLKLDLKKLRLAAIAVEVDLPYHTPWLNIARKDFKQRLKHLDISVKTPKHCYITSVGCELIGPENFERERVLTSLADQLVTPVNFPGQIDLASKVGAVNFIELSPVDVLSPLVEQIMESEKRVYKVDSFRRSVKVTAVGSSQALRIKDSRILKVFNKALKSLSGYSIEDIRMEDRIREDLGIDSIKKADIIFQMIDGMSGIETSTSAPVNLAELATFGDVLDYLENSLQAKSRIESKIRPKSQSFNLMRKTWRVSSAVDFRSAAKTSLCRVRLGDLLTHKPVKIGSQDILVFEWSEQLDFDANGNWPDIESWVEIFKALEVPQKKWVFLHHGTIASDSFVSFLITLAQERGATFKGIKIQHEHILTDDEIEKEVFDFYPTEVVLDEQNQRRVRAYEVLPDQLGLSDRKFRKVLAFGGLGGVGANCLSSFESEALDLLVVVGRSPDSSEVRKKISDLCLSVKKVSYISFDVKNFDQVELLLTRLSDDFGSFDLVLHSVGEEISGLLSQTTSKDIHRIISAKLSLARALYNWARVHPESKIVFNTSMIPEFGNIGQSTYAIVNQFLNGLANQSENIVALLWPAWDQTGMTNQSLILKSLELQGLPILNPNEGKAIFQRSLKMTSGCFLVLAQEYISDYLSASPARGDVRGLYRIASKDREIYSLAGLNLRNLPYLSHHIVKRICPFPASGSMALMIYRGYEQTGRIGVLEKFVALNFLVVNEEASNYLLESKVQSETELALQIRSTHVLADATLRLSDDRPCETELHHFKSARKLFFEFDQNVSVNIGPMFKLEQGIFENEDGSSLAVHMDLERTPHYIGIPILDKLHKILELASNATCLKFVRQTGKMLIPKSVERIEVKSLGFDSLDFYALVGEIRVESEVPVCNLKVVDSQGRLAVNIIGMRSIVISQGKEDTAKDVNSEPLVHEFF